MKNAIILHGMPDKEEYYDSKSPAQSNSHWIPWVQRQLMLKDILTQTPEMPDSYEPDYEKWCSVFNQYKLDADTILIGHSCGAGFFLRWLSENKTSIGDLVLVAPWIDPTNELGDKNHFFDFEIDPYLEQRVGSVCILNSSNDNAVIHQSVKEIIEKLPNTQLLEMEEKGHFTLSGMGTAEFPELLGVILE